MDPIDRQALIDALLRTTTFGNVHELNKFVHKFHLDREHIGGLRDAVFAIVNAPAVQPEQCEDAVSRKAVEEMLKNGFPARGMWEIEGDVVKQTVCETLADALMDLEKLPSARPDIIHCKDCKHRPVTNDNYDDEEWDCGFNIEFPDHKCPCQCDDGWYNRLPDDNWFCGNAERKTDE